MSHQLELCFLRPQPQDVGYLNSQPTHCCEDGTLIAPTLRDAIYKLLERLDPELGASSPRALLGGGNVRVFNVFATEAKSPVRSYSSAYKSFDGWPRISSPSTSGISRPMPANDLLDQFLAKPSSQWARAQ